MKKTLAALLALSVAGCASAPKPQVAVVHPQVNRVAKADKYAAPKPVKTAPVEMPTPNQTVEKRWYDKFKVHPRFFH